MGRVVVDPLRPLLGAHLSIAGGVHMALVRAAELRCAVVQIFTRNQRQWRAKPLTASEIKCFRDTNAKLGPFVLAAHAGYLINLASPARELRERSIFALSADVARCAALGIPLLVVHPGSHLGAGEARGLRRIAAALDRVQRSTRGAPVRICLEITAGSGSSLGHRFDHIARIRDAVADADRVTVCFDTAHAFAAGYDFRTDSGYTNMWRDFAKTIGLESLALFHLNDSARAAGSRCDRHAHIGRGEIGRGPFARILSDHRFQQIPKVIETPKEGGMDAVNLRLLRRLARRTVTVMAAGLFLNGAMLGRMLTGRTLLSSMIGCSLFASVLFGVGCTRDQGWWEQVTGVNGRGVRFTDRWETAIPGVPAMPVDVCMLDGELARMDFPPAAGGYSVVYNRGRTVRVQPPPAQEMLVDRTLFLTYLLPFMGHRALGEALVALGIDTLAVAKDVVWDGKRCLRIGAEKPEGPAIYFDAETGAVLRLLTVGSGTPPRLGEFRLYDHCIRGGAWLPRRLETWGAQGRRSKLVQVAAADTATADAGRFQLPTPGMES